jgi:glycosyltransferase involved in cell wall biosynthesis
MKVSVIIPTYNAGWKLIRAIQSVVMQTAWLKGHTYEVLVCDDCSQDNTLETARQFDKVRILATEHNTGGPNAGRNRGIQNAIGDVITFLDQDDEWLPDKIERQLEQIKQGYEFIYSPCRKELE